MNIQIRSWKLELGKFLLLNFFWKSGLNLHWISMTSLSKHLEGLQSNGNVGPQTQFCKNSELLGSFRKVESWPLFRPQAVHTVFFQTVNVNKVHYGPCLSKRIKAQTLLVFAQRSSFIVSRWVIPWLKMLPNLWFWMLAKSPSPKMALQWSRF